MKLDYRSTSTIPRLGLVRSRIALCSPTCYTHDRLMALDRSLFGPALVSLRLSLLVVLGVSSRRCDRRSADLSGLELSSDLYISCICVTRGYNCLHRDITSYSRLVCKLKSFEQNAVEHLINPRRPLEIIVTSLPSSRRLNCNSQSNNLLDISSPRKSMTPIIRAWRRSK